MNQKCWAVFAGLWPGGQSDWGQETVAEFNRRVRQMPLNEESIIAVLRQYRFEVRRKVPVPNDLLSRLRVAAAGPKAHRLPASEFVAEEHTGGIPFRKLAAMHSAQVHAMIEAACSCPPKSAIMRPREEHSAGGTKCLRCGGSVSGKFWRDHFDPRLRDARRAKQNDEDRKRRQSKAMGQILARVEPDEGRSELRRVLAEHDRVVREVEGRS